jgi:glutamate-ammonia-ligase adenylyltransferase
MLKHSEIAEIRALLLAPELSDKQVAATLRKYGLRHPKTADANLQSIAGEPHTRLLFADLLPGLLSALARSADPDMGLNNLQRFVEAAIGRETLLHSFVNDPGALDLLLLIFITSQHLSDILIQNAHGLDWVRAMEAEDATTARQRMLVELRQDLSILRLYEHRLEEMRRFKNLEVLKIGMRDVLYDEDVETITQRLSALAEAELEAALDVALARLAERHGGLEDLPRQGFAVIGLGKLGGAELNYSSDIDIVFVYDASARPSEGPWALGLSREEYYESLAYLVVEAMSRVMVHGHVFRVDTRLRPDGHMGRLVRSDLAALKYYEERGAPWERQALIKARCVAGDIAFGEEFVGHLRKLVYAKRFAPGASAEVRQMKDRIERELRRRDPSESNVKLGRGGIRDIEFVVQLLQLQHGGRSPRLRVPKTLEALRRLKKAGLISGRDAQSLESAYVFLRKLEHRLQMMHSLQVHALPRGEEELQKLAVRMGFEDRASVPAREAFLKAYERHTTATREIFERFVQQ